MANTSKASTPVKAGETPVNTKPTVSYHDCATAAVTRIDAMMRGGAEAVTYIASALLVGYLHQKSGTGPGVKLDIIKKEFAILLQKKGLGATQTSKYIDYAQVLAANMFKECSFGMEVAALIAATTADKAHNAVNAWVSRHTMGKKTEHGYKLSEALSKLNVLAVFLGKEPDPSKPEGLEAATDTPAQRQQKEQKARKALAEKIGKDPSVLKEVNSDRLVESVANVVNFSVLVSKHVLTVSTADALETELAAIEKAYRDRIKALRAEMGTKAAPKAGKIARAPKAGKPKAEKPNAEAPITSDKAAVA